MNRILLFLILLCSPVQAFVLGAGGGMAAPSGSGPGLDADATAFLVAAGITDATQKTAVYNLVGALKTANIWTKFKAIYPVVGGTATTHKFNLKDPRDLDAAFRVNFSGSWTHSASGMQPTADGAYGDTLIDTGAVAQNSHHVSMNVKTPAQSGYDMGSAETPSPYKGIALGVQSNGGSFIHSDSGQTTTGLSFIQPASFWVLSRNSDAANVNLFQSGTKHIIVNASSTPITGHNLYLGAVNYTGAVQTNRDCVYNFWTVGDGLSDSEVTSLGSAVTAFETALGR